MKPLLLSTWREEPALARLKAVLLHPYTLFLLLTLVVWLPDGFNIGPVNDGWIKLASFLSDARIYHPGITRAFGGIPRDLGMRLADGGFQGWQAFLFLFTFLRGVLYYEIAHRLFPAERAFAIVCGLIALFHPADSAYFWVDVTGVHMALVLALAACLGALIHLQTGSRTALLAMLLFQLAACLTYSGFLILMLAFPVGVWLLRWAEGQPVHWRYLLRTGWLLVGYVFMQALLIKMHFGHEGEVADMRLSRAFWGFGKELQLFFTQSVSVMQGLDPSFLVWALPPALLAGFLAHRDATPAPQDPHRGMRFYCVLCLGLLALAVASYFPYAVSVVRVGARRQLFAAGIFLYTLMALPLFLWLPRRLDMRALRTLLVAACAFAATLIGLQVRDYWVGAYRGEERLLAAIAALAPQPEPGTYFVVRLRDRDQASDLGGFFNRRGAFIYALRLMYGDHKLNAAFTPIIGPDFKFGKDQLDVIQHIRVNKGGSAAPYSQMVIMDYTPAGRAHLLDRDWLQKRAPAGLDVSAYDPAARLGSTPAPFSKVCTMLEKSMRPDYCK